MQNDLELKYNLISKLLSKKNTNEGLLEFQNYLKNDFLEFSNSFTSNAKEVSALFKLQEIEKKLALISCYPEIFKRNIIAVGGGFSAGKSEFISSFITQKDVKLAIGVEPTTAIACYVINDETPKLLACNQFCAALDLAQVDENLQSKMSHEFINSFGFNLKDIMPYTVLCTKLSVPSICFIDTPGYNPSSSSNTFTSEDINTAKSYLQNASALIWLIGLDANGTIAKSDIDFLEQLDLEGKELFIVLNKADLKPKSDIAKIMETVKDVLDDYCIDYAGISAYSSLQGKQIAWCKCTLMDFLQKNRELKNIKEILENELASVQDFYKDAIIKTKNEKQAFKDELKQLSLDLVSTGFDDTNILNEISQISGKITPNCEDALKQLRLEFYKLSSALEKIFE